MPDFCLEISPGSLILFIQNNAQDLFYKCKIKSILPKKYTCLVITAMFFEVTKHYFLKTNL